MKFGRNEAAYRSAFGMTAISSDSLQLSSSTSFVFCISTIWFTSSCRRVSPSTENSSSFSLVSSRRLFSRMVLRACSLSTAESRSALLPNASSVTRDSCASLVANCSRNLWIQSSYSSRFCLHASPHSTTREYLLICFSICCLALRSSCSFFSSSLIMVLS